MIGQKDDHRKFKFPIVQQQKPGNANREIGVPRAAWHSRGYLPHFECAEVPQHVTFHLPDSLPQSVLQQLGNELKTLPAERREVGRRRRLDDCIDAGQGSCVLRRPEIADMTQTSLLRFDSQRYRLIAWVVMPNHVHALFTPMDGWTVAQIVASWKKFTAREICDSRRDRGEIPSGPIWHREYWDRYIRDRRHLAQTIEYIHLNPVKARLVGAAESWRWSSAFPGNANLRIGG
jgi:REP element-mobilizing transposase RayT